MFDSLANYGSQQHTSATDTPPRTDTADNMSSRENAVTSCGDEAATAANSTVSLSALQSPSASPRRSLSLNLFINKGHISDKTCITC